MAKLDQEVQSIMQRLFLFVVPEGMTVKERSELAHRAGISPETLRTALKRSGLNAVTLIRLLLARGVSSKVLLNLPQTEVEQLSKGEAEWLEFGRALSEAERVEFLGLLKYIRSRWSISKKRV